MHPNRLLLLFVALCALAIHGRAAADVKRALSHVDFDGWRSISGQVLSRDGRFLTYAYMPQEGDGEVIVRELAGTQEWRAPVGALPPVLMTGSEADPERPPPRRSVNVTLTSDSRFAVANTFPARADTLQALRAGKSGAELPPEGLVIVELATGRAVPIAGVKSLQVPARGGSWLAYLKTEGELVLRELNSAAERSFPGVTEYSFSRDGRTLLFATASATAAENGVFAVTPGDQAPPLVLASGPGRYRKITWNRTQTEAAFLTDRDEAPAPMPRMAVYHWRRGSGAAGRVLPADAPGLPGGWIVSGDAAPAFTYDGNRLLVSTRPALNAPDPRFAALLEEEKIRADLWRWNDDFIPPLQKVQAEKERQRAYVGTLDLASGRFVQLADPTLALLTFNNDGSKAFGLDDRPYRRRIDYDGIYHDLYFVDATSGSRKLLAREVGEKAGVRWSHDNRWLAWYADRQWFVADSRDGSVHPVSQALPFPVHNERHDMPEMPGAYGSAGWSRDGQSLLIYDRFDLWQVFPDGRPARNLTGGFGRLNQIELRLNNLAGNEPEHEIRGIDLDRALTFRGEHQDTRDTGFFRFSSADSAPQRLLWAAKDHRFVGRALEADTLMLTASRFDEFPDILVTDTNFESPRKVTGGGAQLAPFLWGSASLVRYRGPDGQPLSGMLCKPANFDPTRKYPMIVYIYERLSANLHRFFLPAPLAVIEPSFYTSNGYVVLMPDIAYTTGKPGASAYQCVMAAVDAVVAQGFVDENALGLEGHSWGGYETCYILTQTGRFRAAEAGAIVGNMTSASGAIGESSGRSRQFKYEKNQSRIGATLQEAPHLYVENSPVFFAHRVTTPLLILHNDHDDIVPWPQAVEFFLALRRAGKEAYLFNYNDELHSLRRRADQKDFARRMHQFFDHFLKGVPQPAWMSDGIPYLDREEEKLRFRDPP
ncbi:S9 family peptidase [Oleiharenicola lentus]|uniref:S9 family peptidase n=1 Tax=Oleiharenicola lentus TaxID=2508720 RepID=A0A4Q1CB89_9BACT|nr:prolyl oligopeptidase family serine peptidase [Oleiharenicola lentus]RXK56238.1 S9 family peptidase [Oleiharenicola lentus]